MDLSRWRLRCERGRQVWAFAESEAAAEAEPQSLVEKYLIGTGGPDGRDGEGGEGVAGGADSKTLSAAGVRSQLERAVHFWRQIQVEDGHWPMDYGGPLFLMPGLVITCYATDTNLSAPYKAQMLRYLENQQRDDGGWGIHIESPSTMFGTALNYAALRLLGMPADAPMATKARNWIHENGGAQSIPSWGKFWLATIGCYSWEGMNPLPPEMWLLPYSIPLAPGRFWCHCRMVYLPMSYLYGSKKVCITDLTQAIRDELFPQGYDSIHWPSQKWNCHTKDMYYPPGWFLKSLYAVLGTYESYHSGGLRKRALREAALQIDQEDQSTNYIDIGPVSKAMNMLAVFYEHGPDSAEFKSHQARVHDYLWLGTDGMKMQGYNGSQLWETAFSLQALSECDMQDDERVRETLVRGMKFLDCSQVIQETPTIGGAELSRYYRHISKGAWPFSTRDHGWPISDCTSEGLKACLALMKFDFIEPLEQERYFWAVNYILSMQNSSGGWATYELKRGPDVLELLNPSEVFYGIIVDYPYVECTSACIQAITAFRRRYQDHRSDELQAAVDRGIQFIKTIQRPDGGWIGSWGVCFTYGTWFGIEALMTVGTAPDASEVVRACDFLIEKQRPDGGWGEDFKSCVEMRWVEHEQSQVVNTAWAVMSLMAARHKDTACIRRGIKFLLGRQLENGDWRQEGISGVFNANCAISYSSYKNVFPTWALARYLKLYGDVEDL